MSTLLCTIYLVRHGQSEANLEDLYGLDTPLTQKGKEQIKQLSDNLQNIHFDAILSSTMIRAKQSAEILAIDHQLVAKTYEALKERHYGSFEGRKGNEVYKELNELFEKRSKLIYKDRLKFKFNETYESDEELLSRFLTTLREIAITYAGKTVLIVSHVSAMKNLLFHLEYAKHNEMEGQAIENSGYIKLKSDGIDFFIDEVVGRKTN